MKTFKLALVVATLIGITSMQPAQAVNLGSAAGFNAIASGTLELLKKNPQEATVVLAGVAVMCSFAGYATYSLSHTMAHTTATKNDGILDRCWKSIIRGTSYPVGGIGLGFFLAAASSSVVAGYLQLFAKTAATAAVTNASSMR